MLMDRGKLSWRAGLVKRAARNVAAFAAEPSRHPMGK